MPFYFFSVRDGTTSIADEEGADLPDLGAADAEARAVLREFAIQALRHHYPVDRYQVEIYDAEKQLVGVLKFSDIVGGGDEPGNET
jgi:hypothetical protein